MAPIVVPFVVGAAATSTATVLGAGAITAAVVGGAAASAAGSYMAGARGSDVWKSAAIGGATAGVGSYVGSAVSGMDALSGYSPAVRGAISQGVGGAAASGLGAAVTGGDVGQAMLTGGTVSAVSGYLGGRQEMREAADAPQTAPTSEMASRGAGSLLAEGEGAGLTFGRPGEPGPLLMGADGMPGLQLANVPPDSPMTLGPGFTPQTQFVGPPATTPMVGPSAMVGAPLSNIYTSTPSRLTLSGSTPTTTYRSATAPAAETQAEMLARQNMGLFGAEAQQAADLMLDAQEVGLRPGLAGPTPGSPTDIWTRAPSSTAVGPGTVTPMDGSRLTLGAPEDRVQLNRVDSPEGGILSQVWGNLTDRATDPERLTDLAILAGASILPSLIAGPPPGMPDFAPPEDFDVNQMREGLTEEERWLLDQQIAELQRLYERDEELFVERMNMVRSLLAQAEHFDPDYWGNMAQRNIRSTMARQSREAEREAMLTGRPISETTSRQDALDAAIAGETGYLAGVDTAARQQMLATTGAVGQLPQTGPQTFADYTPNITAMTGLGMDRMGSAFDRAGALQDMRMNYFDSQSQDYARRLAALGTMSGTMAGAFLYPRNQGATG